MRAYSKPVTPLQAAETELALNVLAYHRVVCELQQLFKKSAAAYALGENSARKLVKKALDLEAELTGDTKASSFLAEAYYPGEDL